MAIIKVEGKSLTIPDEIVKAGKDAIRAAISVDFPAVENADIEIVGSTSSAPATVSVVKRAAPKGSPLSPAQAQVLGVLESAPEYINPAIALAAEAMRAEAMGDAGFLESALRRGEVERAIAEGSREGVAVYKALVNLGHAQPTTSNTVPVGF